jgi:hypothetical protein
VLQKSASKKLHQKADTSAGNRNIAAAKNGGAALINPVMMQGDCFRTVLQRTKTASRRSTLRHLTAAERLDFTRNVRRY